MKNMTNRSMAALAAVVALTLGIPVAQAQLVEPDPAAATGPAPKITFATTNHDFGKINSGEPVRHEFIFTNTGSATLEITEVKPSCGCTTAGTWDKKVEPGKTGMIPLQFNPTGFGGAIAKSATITCNDPSQKIVTLKLSGTVWKPIDITPNIASFVYQAEDQTNQTKSIRIVNNTETPLVLSEPKSTHSAFQVELKTNAPGKDFELLITATPPFTNRSAFGSISVKTSVTNTPTLGVSAHVTVQQQLTMFPETLYLPPGPLTNAVNLAVTIRYSGSNTLTLSNVTASIPGAMVQMHETQPGHLFSIRANFPVGTLIKPGTSAELTANTSHPKFPALHVPIIHTVAPAISPLTQPLGPTRVISTNAFFTSPRPQTIPATRTPLPAVPH
jgi:hypothetical protein